MTRRSSNLATIEQRHWLIIRTATRQETRAMSSLKEAGFTAYCPKRTVWDRLAKEAGATKQIALFPGYAFVEEPANGDVHPITEADGVHGFLWVYGEHQKQPAMMPGRYVDDMRAAEALGAFNDAVPKPRWKPKTDEAVRVVQGPFTGFVGRIVEARGDKRVRVLIEAFGKPLSLKTEQVEAAA